MSFLCNFPSMWPNVVQYQKQSDLTILKNSLKVLRCVQGIRQLKTLWRERAVVIVCLSPRSSFRSVQYNVIVFVEGSPFCQMNKTINMRKQKAMKRSLVEGIFHLLCFQPPHLLFSTFLSNVFLQQRSVTCYSCHKLQSNSSAKENELPKSVAFCYTNHSISSFVVSSNKI